MFHCAEGLHTSIALLADDATRRMRALFQCQQADLVRISKTGLFTANGAYAHTLVNIVRAIFDDAVFQYPGFVIARLEIQITVIHTALGQLAEDGKQILMVQAIRRQQLLSYQVQTHRLATL